MDKLRLGLEWFLNPDHVPLLVAEELGFFREAGLHVELVEPKAHMDAIDAIDSGELDVAVTEPIHLVEDRAKGRDAVGFARFLHTNGGVMYLESSGIRRPRDLAGKRVQYPGAPGPGGKAIVATMIEADGGEADVDALVPVNHGFRHTDALVEGKADVATLAFYNFEVVEARHRGHAASFFALKDWGVPDFCQLVLVTNGATFAAKREPLRRLLGVMSKGLDVIHQRPAEARRIYFERTNTDPNDGLMSAIFDATVPCFTFDFSMSEAYYERLYGWMRARGLVAGPVEARTVFSNALV